MTAASHVGLERVYDHLEETGGKRVLVDRVWPRGLKKQSLSIDLWLKEVGPSDDLRHWFGHQPERWPEFQRRYRAELKRPPQRELLEQLIELARQGPLTLLYGAKDRERNQAVALRSVIEEHLKTRG